METTRRLDGHSALLEEARNDVVRTISTGADILTNLNDQEEKLKRISNRVWEKNIISRIILQSSIF